jgi:hypothetical protein
MSGLTYVGPEEGRGEDLDDRGLQRIQEQHSLHHMPHTQAAGRGDRGEALVAYRIFAPWDGLKVTERREALSWLCAPCQKRALWGCVCVLCMLLVYVACSHVPTYGECPDGGDEEAAGDPMVQRPRRSLGQHTAVLVVLAA